MREPLTDPVFDSDDWFYLSFADGELPTGSQFLGGAYINAPDLATAVTRAHQLGINPGGEVQLHGPIPEAELAANVPEEDRERLLTAAEINGERTRDDRSSRQ